MGVQTRSQRSPHRPVESAGGSNGSASPVQRRARRRSTTPKPKRRSRSKPPKTDRWALLAKINFGFCRGLSSFCFIPAHLYSISLLSDPYAAWAMFVIFVGSMLWNNLSFALPQSMGIKFPLWLVVFAAVADGFGIVGSNLKLIAYALKLSLGGPWPWVVAAGWMLYEYILLICSQCPKHSPETSQTSIFSSGWDEQPKFIGYDGRTVWTKLYYPFRIHVVRSLSIVSAFLCAMTYLGGVAWRGIRQQTPDDDGTSWAAAQEALCIMGTMVANLVVGYITYMTNGYDKDFTCPKVWVWHGCLGVVSLGQIYVLGKLGA